MANLLIIGNDLMTLEEYSERRQVGNIEELKKKEFESRDPNQFTPIGLGKPLCVEIRTILEIIPTAFLAVRKILCCAQLSKVR